MVITVPLFLLTIIAASFSCYCLLSLPLRNTEFNKGLYAGVSFGLGPLWLSFILGQVYTLVPHQGDLFYIIVVLITLSIPLIFNWKAVIQLYKHLKKSLIYLVNEPKYFSLILICLIVVAVLTQIIVGMLTPVMANDPLEYLQAARLIYEQGTIENYPFINSDDSDGFYCSWTHPLGFINLLAWGFLISGSAQNIAVSGLVSSLVAPALVPLSLGLFRVEKVFLALVTSLLLFTTPIFYLLIQDNHIDILRIISFTAAIVVIYDLIIDFSSKKIICSGIAIGLALTSHSINILILPFISAILFFCYNKDSLLIRTAVLLGIVTIASLFIGKRWLINYELYGNIIADNTPIWEISKLKIQDHLRVSRGLTTTGDRLLWGVLKPFTKSRTLGINYWLLLSIAFVTLYGKRGKFTIRGICAFLTQKFSLMKLCIWVIVMFHSLVLLTFLIDVDLIIKNDRYVTTVEFFVVILVAILFYEFADKHRSLDVSKYFKIFGSANSIFSRLSNRFALQGVQKVLVCLILILLLFRVLNFSRFYVSNFHFTNNTLFSTTEQKLLASGNPIYKVIDFVNEYCDKGDKVLVFRKSDFGWYSKSRMREDLDPKMTDLYLADSPDEGWEILRQQQVDYIYQPDYETPLIYNSVLDEIIGDEKYSTLVFDNHGYRLLRVNDSIQIKDSSNVVYAVDYTKGNPFLNSEVYGVSPKQILRHSWFEVNEGVTIKNKRRILSNQNNIIGFSTGRGDPYTPPFNSFNSELGMSGGVYGLTTRVGGKGLLAINLIQYSEKGEFHKVLLWKGIVDDDERTIKRQFEFIPSYIDSHSQFRITYELIDGGEIKIKDLSIKELNNELTDSYYSKTLINRTINNGWTINAEGGLLPSQVKWGVMGGADDNRYLFLSPFDRRRITISSKPVAIETLDHKISSMQNLDDLKISRKLFDVDTVMQYMHAEFSLYGKGSSEIRFLSKCFNERAFQLVNKYNISLPGQPSKIALPIEYNCSAGDLKIEIELQVSGLINRQLFQMGELFIDDYLLIQENSIGTRDTILFENFEDSSFLPKAVRLPEY